MPPSSPSPRWRIGVDIGGIFTDVAMVEETSGRIALAKVLTTPPDFDRGVLAGLRQGLTEQGIDPARLESGPLDGCATPEAAARLHGRTG